MDWYPFHSQPDPKARAHELLLEHLDPEQRRDLARQNAFDTTGEDGDTWQIHRYSALHIVPNDYNVEYGIAACGDSDLVYPMWDSMLAIKLLVETDLKTLKRIACH